MGEGSINQRAREFVARRAAPLAVTAAAAANILRQDVTVRLADAVPQKGDYVLLKCNCHHARCCKLLSFNAVYEGVRLQRRDPTGCPADCGDKCATYSKLVESFLPIVDQMLSEHWYVWDIHDVPYMPKMHIDMMAVSPISPSRVFRFEIDGSVHFSEQNTSRQNDDVLKDVIMNLAGVSMLRMHHCDEKNWTEAVWAYILAVPRHVMYTAAYGRIRA